MRSPRNPTRRNRNIGTAKQGHGADNKLTIPISFVDSRAFYERLDGAREYTFEVHGITRVALVQPPAEGYLYGCTVSDLAKLLAMVPEDDIDLLTLFLFRQPTRKQQLLSSAWGRFIYYAVPGKHRGTAICLESQRLQPRQWPNSMSSERTRELERLRADGHKITTGKRSTSIGIDEVSLRNTSLYRTALHEIGHFVDWSRSVLCVEGSEEEVDAADRAFGSKPSAMKEDFAHRYASESAEALRAKGSLPFPVCWDTAAMAKAGIERSWFVGA